MANLVKYMPEVEADELLSLNFIVKDMNEEQIKSFAEAFRIKSKTRSNLWIFYALSALGLGGAHRLYLGQVGMGLLYFLTWNFCLVGLVIDIFASRSMVSTYNLSEANKVARLIRATID